MGLSPEITGSHLTGEYTRKDGSCGYIWPEENELPEGQGRPGKDICSDCLEARSEAKTHRCPIRGHNHEVVKIADHTQEGTGQRAAAFECPKGLYRWFVIEGRELSDYIRQRRPRFGWKKSQG